MAKAAASKVNVSAIQKIVALLEQRHKENGALIDEIKRLAGGGPGIGEILKEFYAYWIELWPHGTYVFTYEKDAPHVKRFVRELGVEELWARALRYLKSTDPFYAEKKHPFPMFVATINKWAAPAQELELAAPPTGCTHKPPCKDDVAHTKKRQAEMRS